MCLPLLLRQRNSFHSQTAPKLSYVVSIGVADLNAFDTWADVGLSPVTYLKHVKSYWRMVVRGMGLVSVIDRVLQQKAEQVDHTGLVLIARKIDQEQELGKTSALCAAQCEDEKEDPASTTGGQKKLSCATSSSEVNYTCNKHTTSGPAEAENYCSRLHSSLWQSASAPFLSDWKQKSAGVLVCPQRARLKCCNRRDDTRVDEPSTKSNAPSIFASTAHGSGSNLAACPKHEDDAPPTTRAQHQ
ncbi:unnamed protein product, partial [Amoebophrya sp. A120]|eukprot:GSA120T00003604001.1